MATQLPSPAAEYLIDQILVPHWDPSQVSGFDISAGMGSDAFCPVGESLDDVGRAYPSLTVARTTETSGGETSYDFLTSSGPGQNRTGQLLVSTYVEDDKTGDGYTGDSGTYSAVDADELAVALRDHVDDIIFDNANAPGTEFSFVGSFPSADVPDDDEASPTVRIEQVVISYSWIREP